MAVTDKIVQLREGLNEFYENCAPNNKYSSDLYLRLDQELNEIQGEVFALLLKVKDKEDLFYD